MVAGITSFTNSSLNVVQYFNFNFNFIRHFSKITHITEVYSQLDYMYQGLLVHQLKAFQKSIPIPSTMLHSQCCHLQSLELVNYVKHFVRFVILEQKNTLCSSQKQNCYNLNNWQNFSLHKIFLEYFLIIQKYFQIILWCNFLN